MKICFVNLSFYPSTYYGGPVVSSYNVSLHLAKNNKVLVITSDANGPRTKLKVKTNTYLKLARNLITIYYQNTFSDLFSISFIFSAWKQIRWADVVHLYSPFSPMIPISLLYCKIFKKPVLFSPMGQFGPWCLDHGNKLKNAWVRFIIHPLSRHIVWHATSQKESDDISSLFPNSRIVVIPDGINTEEFKNPLKFTRKEFALRYLKGEVNPSHIIISMGRLHKVKGFDILIRAFEIVRKKFPAACLAIAGPDAGEKNQLNRFISELNLNKSVFLVDELNRNDKINYLSNADVFVLCSHHENFGIVYAEALASGTPIVATKATPWSIVEQYNCGKWVENTPVHISNAMEMLLSIDQKEEISANAKRLIDEHFCWDKISLTYNGYFAKMVEK
jgi:glycosyltransferase involved in cell wall biosynthesis